MTSSEKRTAATAVTDVTVLCAKPVSEKSSRSPSQLPPLEKPKSKDLPLTTLCSILTLPWLR